MATNLPPLGVFAAVEGASKFMSTLKQMRGELNKTTQAVIAQQGVWGRASSSISSNITNIGKSFSKTGNKMQSVGRNMSTLGSRLTFAFTTMFGAISVGSISAASTFEREMTKINTLVGLTADEVSKLSDVTLDIAPDVGATPTSLSRALFVITSAGIRDVAEAQDILTAAAQSSAIGLGDVGDVARITTSVIQAYGHDVLNASVATDVLTAIVREGNLEADKLAPSLGRVIPIASQLGVSFQEVGAFIATFTRLGVPAEVAVTSLRAALSAILKPTTASKEALAEYGISISDLRAQIADPSVGLSKTLLGLVGVLSQDDEALSQVIGNVRGLSGVLGVAGNLGDDYTQILSNIQNSHGIVADGFETVGKTAAFQWEQVKASVQVAAIEIGTSALPSIKLLAQEIVRVSQAIAEFVRQNPELTLTALKFATIGAAVGPVVFIFGALISSVGVIISSIGSLIAILGSLVGAVLSVKGVFAGLVAAFISVFSIFNDDANAFFSGLSSNMEIWGQNITEAFAEGMIKGAIEIVNVLTEIGNIISNWLAPGSPPKLLPDLDKWGAGALTAYMDGWLQGDFDVFNDIFSELERFLSSADIKDGELPNLMLRLGESLAMGINDVRMSGAILDSTVRDITSVIGDSTPEIDEFVRATIDAAIANKKLSTELAPIDERLRQIADRRQEIQDEAGREKLSSIVGDLFASRRAKELARLSIEEMDLKRRRGAIEQRGNRQIKIAEERLAIAKSVLGIQTKTNQLLQKIADALGGIGGAGGAGRAGGVGRLRAATPRIGLPTLESLGLSGPGPMGLRILEQERIHGLTEPISSAVSELTEDINNLKDSVFNLGDAWRPLLPIIGKVALAFLAIKVIGLGNILTGIWFVINSLLLPAIVAIGSYIFSTLIPAIGAFLVAFGAIPALIIAAVVALAYLVSNWDLVVDRLPRLWEQVKTIFSLIVKRAGEFIDNDLPEWWAGVVTFFSGLDTKLFEIGKNFIGKIVEGIKSFDIGSALRGIFEVDIPGLIAPGAGGAGSQQTLKRRYTGEERSVPPVVMPSTGGVGGGVQVNVSTGDINNTTDLDGFTNRVRQAVTDVLR